MPGGVSLVARSSARFAALGLEWPLTPPMPFKAVSILLILAARASFLRVLRLPRFDSSKIHSWPPDLQRCEEGQSPRLGLVRGNTACCHLLTLHGPLGPLESSGMQRILILRQLEVLVVKHNVAVLMGSLTLCRLASRG